MQNHWLKKPLQDRVESGYVTGGLHKVPGLHEPIGKSKVVGQPVDFKFTQNPRCSAYEYITLCFHGSPNYKSGEICADLGQYLPFGSLISKQAKENTPLFKIPHSNDVMFIIAKINWVCESGQTTLTPKDQVKMELMYEIKRPKINFHALAHGLVSVTIYPEELIKHIHSYEDKHSLLL